MNKLDNPMYVHCRQCISEDATTHIEVAVAGSKIQVWCQVHDTEIATFELATSVNFPCAGGQPR